jgi:hypothetical protein
MALHPNPIAKDCSAGKRACRIYGQDADRFRFLAVKGGNLVYKRTFANARGTREANNMSFARMGIKPLEDTPGRGKFIVNIPQEASYRPHIA